MSPRLMAVTCLVIGCSAPARPPPPRPSAPPEPAPSLVVKPRAPPAVPTAEPEPTPEPTPEPMPALQAGGWANATGAPSLVGKSSVVLYCDRSSNACLKVVAFVNGLIDSYGAERLQAVYMEFWDQDRGAYLIQQGVSWPIGYGGPEDDGGEDLVSHQALALDDAHDGAYPLLIVVDSTGDIDALLVGFDDKTLQALRDAVAASL